MKLNTFETRMIDPSLIRKGPVRGTVSKDQMERYVAVAKVCKEFDDTPLDDWMDSAARDLRREKELRLWEGIAVAFVRLSLRFKLSPSGRRQLGQALIGSTLGQKLAVKGVPAKAIETALSRDFKLIRTDVLIFTDYRCVDSLKTTIRPLAFENQGLVDAYFKLLERFPEWGPVDDDATDDGTNVCIAVYDDYPEIIPMGFCEP